ncbi:MAG: SDR family oxidoreductase [Bacteroidetes bacterium]|nr:SDR family oxidoreductase [Bacteroidota bacterium]
MTATSLYTRVYHSDAIKDAHVLVSGGAGFIGSNIVEYLIHHGAAKVRVLDNLSNGFQRNLEPFLSLPNFEFMEGDITNPADCERACKGMNLLTHQAALGSVPRSIKNPIATSDANTTGFLNMLLAARDAGVNRVVYASSSSVYGDSTISPKKESNLGKPLSPYAVSKLTNELYASVFAMHYGMEIIGLRYFNVFGPNQDPNGPYAAAIPLFMNSLLFGKDAVIYGDGEQTRDFTFVENAVQANIRALFTTNTEAFNKVYNVAVGESVSVNKLYKIIGELSGNDKSPSYAPERKGDIKNSLADITMAKNLLGYEPNYLCREGLDITVAWFRKAFAHV